MRRINPKRSINGPRSSGGVAEVTGTDFLWLDPGVVDAQEAFDAAIQWIGRGGPFSVVVVDAVESHGCPSDGSPINEWWESHVSPWRSTECAVVLLDHVPKRRQDRPKGGIGSVHKLSRLDGAGLRVSGAPWTKREPGALHLYPEKDRPGDIPGNPTTPAAVVVGDYWSVGGERAFKATIEAPKKEISDTLPGEILAAFGERGSVTGQRALCAMVKGKTTHIIAATERLVQDGSLAVDTTGTAHVWTITDKGLETTGQR